LASQRGAPFCNGGGKKRKRQKRASNHIIPSIAFVQPPQEISGERGKGQKKKKAMNAGKAKNFSDCIDGSDGAQVTRIKMPGPPVQAKTGKLLSSL